MPTFLFVYTICVCLKGRERFAFVRLREASRTAVQSVWLVSYVVSRVTVFLTAQYFKARFVWKCLHSTCTAVGLAVVAFIRLSVSSFGALMWFNTQSAPHLRLATPKGAYDLWCFITCCICRVSTGHLKPIKSNSMNCVKMMALNSIKKFRT